MHAHRLHAVVSLLLQCARGWGMGALQGDAEPALSGLQPAQAGAGSLAQAFVQTLTVAPLVQKSAVLPP